MRSHDKSNDDLRTRNCATAVADALLPTKIIDNRSPLPGRVFQEMMLIEGAEYHFIPKGGKVPASLINSIK